MKKLIIGLVGLVALIGSVNAQSFYITNNLAASNHVLVTTAHVLNQITLYSTNAAPTLVRLYDGPLTYSFGAHTNYVQYTTNRVRTYITTGGTTNSYTNLVLYGAPVAVAAGTNSRAAIATIVVPAAPGIVTVDDQYLFNRYAMLSNNQAGLVVTYQYRLP